MPAKPPPSEIQSFFLIPPPPITRQHAEGGNEHFSLSPLPMPTAARDRHCCSTGVGEKGKRKIGGGEPLKTILIKKNLVRFFLQVIIVRLISNFRTDTGGCNVNTELIPFGVISCHGTGTAKAMARGKGHCHNHGASICG